MANELEKRITRLESTTKGTHRIEPRYGHDGELLAITVHGVEPLPGESEDELQVRLLNFLPTRTVRELLASIAKNPRSRLKPPCIAQSGLFAAV